MTNVAEKRHDYYRRYKRVDEPLVSDELAIEFLYDGEMMFEAGIRQLPIYWLDPKAKRLKKTAQYVSVSGFDGRSLNCFYYRRRSNRFGFIVSLKEIPLNDPATLEILVNSIASLEGRGVKRLILVRDLDTHYVYVCSRYWWDRYVGERERNTSETLPLAIKVPRLRKKK